MDKTKMYESVSRKCYFYCLEDLHAVAFTFTADSKALTVLFDGYLLHRSKMIDGASFTASAETSLCTDRISMARSEDRD